MYAMSIINTGNRFPSIDDLHVFITITHTENFSKAAQELGVSPAYISKRIKILEKDLNTKLFHRDTRNLTLTEEGKSIVREAVQLLDDMNALVEKTKKTKEEISGKINICTSFGFGINYVSKAISQLSALYPQLNTRLHLTDEAVDLVVNGFDLEIKVGDDIKGQNRAQKLANNYRVLCASPEYINKYGMPEKLEDLANHNCIFIQEKNSSLGLWKLEKQGNEYSIRIKSHLSTNCGSVAMQWCLDSQGIILRSWWDVAPYIKDGSLIHVLPDYRESANIWAVYPGRLSESEKLNKCIAFFSDYFERVPYEKIPCFSLYDTEHL